MDEELVAAAHALVLAEQEYRATHDLFGAGHVKTGRAWDLMRRASDDLRALLVERYKAIFAGAVTKSK